MNDSHDKKKLQTDAIDKNEELVDDYFRFERENDESCSEEEDAGQLSGFDATYVDEAIDLQELKALMCAASKTKKKTVESTDQIDCNGGYVDSNEPSLCEEYCAPTQKAHNVIADMLANSFIITNDRVRRELDDLELPVGGSNIQIRDRLKRGIRKELNSTRECEDDFGRNRLRQNFDFLIVIDFECTCEDEVYDYPFEIIEFPAVLVDTNERKIVAQFRSFVRPKINPILSEFCTKLTGIKQSDVNGAPRFVHVLEKFRRWVQSHVYPSGTSNTSGAMKSYAIVTDGPWDIGKFLQMECVRSQQLQCKIPHMFRCYINIRRVFTLKYRKTHTLNKVNLAGMLTILGMEFLGREHCGLDDAINVGRIAIRIMEEGAEFRINEKLVPVEYADNYTSFAPSLPTSGLSVEERDRRKWRHNLPYRIVNICKDRFVSGSYADCDSCDEEENFYEKAKNRKT